MSHSVGMLTPEGVLFRPSEPSHIDQFWSVEGAPPAGGAMAGTAAPESAAKAAPPSAVQASGRAMNIECLTFMGLKNADGRNVE